MVILGMPCGRGQCRAHPQPAAGGEDRERLIAHGHKPKLVQRMLGRKDQERLERNKREPELFHKVESFSPTENLSPLLKVSQVTRLNAPKLIFSV